MVGRELQTPPQNQVIATTKTLCRQPWADDPGPTTKLRVLPSNDTQNPMRILFIGDIFGRPGRTIVKDRLPSLVKEHAIDLVLANGENSAAGFGITPPLAEDLFEMGIDVLTTGNHIWDKREIIDFFEAANGNPHSPGRRVLRPAD